MKFKWKWHIYYSVQVLLAFATALIIVDAYRHRSDADRVFLAFNIYALMSVVLSLFVVVRTDRGKQRKQLAARKRQSYLTENLTMPAVLWSDDFKMAVINQKLTDVTGVTAAEDSDLRGIVGGFFGKPDMTDEDIREIVQTRNFPFCFTAPEGAQHELMWTTSSLETDSDGVTIFLSIATDLTELKSVRNELADYSRRLAISEGRYALSMELTEIGILLIQQDNPHMYPSDKLRAMLGVEGESITVTEMHRRIHPDDDAVFKRFQRNMQQHMRSYIGEVHLMELRVRACDGEYHWFLFRYQARENPVTGGLVVGGAVIDISEQKEQEAKIEQLAYIDAVTGIPNRNRLMMRGSELYGSNSETDGSYWVIVTDIDRFHLINDTCGYEAGNGLLRSFAEILDKLAESYDGFGARISGDNFAIILRDAGNDNLPAQVIGRIQHALTAEAGTELSNRNLSCSAGYAKMPDDGESFEEVLERAEFALSSGKREHGSINRYTPLMRESVIRESNLEAELAEGITRGELVLYYQPKIVLATGELIGLEALIRWQHPSGSLIAPTVFIPIAEKSDLITRISQFVMEEACRQTREWQMKGLPPIVMSINVSSTDFYQENICERLVAALKQSNLDARWLEIELTESLALKDIDLTVKQMNQIRAEGIKIAMDDFGTGYSSLSYLQQLPFTMLKMDRSFVQEMDTDPVVREIVCSVVRIAKAKRIHTIVEGVETPEQARLLRLFGCDYIQGYLYGRPMNAADTEAFMRRNIKERKVY